MGYLDGVKRSSTIRLTRKIELAKAARSPTTNLSKIAYQEGVKVWNKDMTVDPKRSKSSSNSRRSLKPPNSILKRFFDNSLIREVNRDYGVEVVSGPGKVKLAPRQTAKAEN